MDYKTKKISLKNIIIISFTIVMTITIFTIASFVKKTFEYEFGKYVDESNKIEVEHLVFDLRNIYIDGTWNEELIKELGEDAINKGIALEIYNNEDELIWSIFEDEKILSNETLNEIKENMQSINQNWNGKLKDYKENIYDKNNNLIGYEKIYHYESLYYMENDIRFLSIINNFMKIISILAIGSIIFISILLSKSISNPIEKVSQVAKVIGNGKYKDKIKDKSSIKEVDELILSINKLSTKLSEQEELRKRLTTDIAHELRTPITSVQGHLDAIIDGIWEASTERLISIREEVTRLSEIIGRLRYLAKFDSDNKELNKTKVNLNELIQNIVYNYESEALEKNIKINYNCDNITIYVDKNQFYQVIINLLTNAIKYTNNNGFINITSYYDNQWVNISIKDNGIGIPKGDLQYIFERFYRVDKSRSKNTGGIGIGLSIVKSIIDAHNGEIFVESKLNEGTEFLIKLHT